VFLSQAGPASDGTLILYKSDRTGQLELYGLKIDGHITQQFTYHQCKELSGGRRAPSGP
jgi:hypothetical protein